MRLIIVSLVVDLLVLLGRGLAALFAAGFGCARGADVRTTIALLFASKEFG